MPGLTAKSYARMVRRQSLRYAFDTFLQVHLFDLRHKVQTAPIRSLAEYESNSPNLEFAFQYQASWTSTTRKLFHLSRSLLRNQFAGSTFIDVGCGMGKVGLAWQKLLQRHNDDQRMLFIEFEEPLLHVAEANFARMFPRKTATFMATDVLEVDFHQISGKVIFFLQNPFTPKIMIDLAARIADLDHIILLANPTLSSTIMSCGYDEVTVVRSYHQLGRGAIFMPQRRSS